MYTMPAGAELTADALTKFLKQHEADCVRYKYLRDMYESNHVILHAPDKAAYKPDNRLVVNFPKYIVDTLNGFFIGIPVKVTSDDKNVNEYLQLFDAYNGTDDANAEISKICSIYGNGYEMLHMDENAEPALAYFTPLDGFVIYDDSILHRYMYGVHVNWDDDGNITGGSYSDSSMVHYFEYVSGKYVFTEDIPHYFGETPITEYMDNQERIGAFESVCTLVDEFNKAISEKANDVDYYADAYLKILGSKLDEETLKTLRDNRIINLEGDDAEKVIVEFMEKPSGDGTQENLIERLQNLIFHISMVANINDETFGNASGTALKFKLQSMSNLAATKERKFTAGLQRRYRLISNIPNSKIPSDGWLGIKYKFTRNIPSNELEEAQIASQLAGIVSQETQLSVLSIVDDPQSEMERMKKEGEDEEMPPRTPTTETVDTNITVTDDGAE
jgi:SPP1 family phage portal protein